MTITKDNAAQYAEILRWLADDGVVQVRNPGYGTWSESGSLSLDFDVESYRRKPQKTLRPWKPEEVPVGAVVRHKTIILRRGVILYCNSETAVLGSGATMLPADMIREMEWQWPGPNAGDVWFPCGVEEGGAA